MFTTTNVTTRDLLRNYKRVINQVKTTKEPAVVVSQKKPQVAIVSLADLEALRDLRHRDSGRVLRETARRVRAVLKDEHLPADLSVHHDEYLWGDKENAHLQDA
jgi:PHD/YefM family antitoxin component YafN of YafNO toxin-antitoxin module